MMLSAAPIADWATCVKSPFRQSIAEAGLEPARWFTQPGILSLPSPLRPPTRDVYFPQETRFAVAWNPLTSLGYGVFMECWRSVIVACSRPQRRRQVHRHRPSNDPRRIAETAAPRAPRRPCCRSSVCRAVSARRLRVAPARQAAQPLEWFRRWAAAVGRQVAEEHGPLPFIAARLTHFVNPVLALCTAVTYGAPRLKITVVFQMI